MPAAATSTQRKAPGECRIGDWIELADAPELDRRSESVEFLPPQPPPPPAGPEPEPLPPVVKWVFRLVQRHDLQRVVWVRIG